MRACKYENIKVISLKLHLCLKARLASYVEEIAIRYCQVPKVVSADIGAKLQSLDRLQRLTTFVPCARVNDFIGMQLYLSMTLRSR